ncbi:MAG: hypothetical protein R3B99_13070 [Polyangiales bacterium]
MTDVLAPLRGLDVDDRTLVHELVRTLELAYARDYRSIRHAYATCLSEVATLLPSTDRLESTLRAARDVVEGPTGEEGDEAWAELSRAATRSYPFGPGDGCHCVDALGVQGCGPGSGCRSGAGTFDSIALTVGYAPVAAATRDVLARG